MVSSRGQLRPGIRSQVPGEQAQGAAHHAPALSSFPVSQITLERQPDIPNGRGAYSRTVLLIAPQRLRTTGLPQSAHYPLRNFDGARLYATFCGGNGYSRPFNSPISRLARLLGESKCFCRIALQMCLDRHTTGVPPRSVQVRTVPVSPSEARHARFALHLAACPAPTSTTAHPKERRGQCLGEVPRYTSSPSAPPSSALGSKSLTSGSSRQFRRWQCTADSRSEYRMAVDAIERSPLRERDAILYA